MRAKAVAVTKIFALYEIIPFDTAASEEYGRIRAELEMMGKIIDPNDLVIAVTVLSNGGTLVTNNTKEFSRIKTCRLRIGVSYNSNNSIFFALHHL